MLTAICTAAHRSEAAEYLSSYHRDQEGRAVMTCNGTSAKYLVVNSGWFWIIRNLPSF